MPAVKAPTPQRQEHVAELAHGGIGQHALDVVLHQADGGREDRRERADRGHHGQRRRRQLKYGVHARDHVHARRHHGGRVDQRADRRGAFHGVRQPDVQRNLRRLAGGADEQQQRDGRQHAVAHLKAAGLQRRPNFREAERAERAARPNSPEDEAGVADAVDDEGLLARVRGRLAQEVESDQQVAAQPHAFPADEQQQVVVGQHQRQHGEHEQVQVAEEAVVAALVRHVADGVDVDQEADAGDHQQHHRRERIEQHAPLRVEVAPACPSPCAWRRPAPSRRAPPRRRAAPPDAPINCQMAPKATSSPETRCRGRPR